MCHNHFKIENQTSCLWRQDPNYIYEDDNGFDLRYNTKQQSKLRAISAEILQQLDCHFEMLCSGTDIPNLEMLSCSTILPWTKYNIKLLTFTMFPGSMIPVAHYPWPLLSEKKKKKRKEKF